MRQGFPVTIAELVTSGAAPLPAEAAAIVLEVCSKVVSGPRQVVTAPISTASVFVEADGSVAVAGGRIVEDDQTVSLLGHLLLEILRSGRPVPQRPAARLEALGLQAAANLEASGLTLERFTAAVRRFAPEDPGTAVRLLFERWRRGGRLPAAENSRIPETLRRLLPEADLAAMAGVTPTLHGLGGRALFAHAGRRLVLTAGTLLLLSLAGVSYLLWDAGKRPAAAAPGRTPVSASAQPGAARELAPAGASASRPVARPPSAGAGDTRLPGRRGKVDPN